MEGWDIYIEREDGMMGVYRERMEEGMARMEEWEYGD